MSGPADTKNLIKINAFDVLRDIAVIRKGFAAIDEGLRKKYLGAAAGAAIIPAFRRFKQLIPIGPTRNLRGSAAKVVRRYEYTSVALCGYAMDGTDGVGKGYHQGFIEYGTDVRFTRGEYASSYKSKSRGAFETEYLGDGEYRHTPAYPWAFMARAKRGESMLLGRSPKGGKAGISPLSATWAETEPQCRQILLTKVVEGFDKAVDEQLRRIIRGARG